jgi:hypothetical protein
VGTDKPLGLIHFNHRLADGEVAWNPPGTGPRNPNYGDMLVCAALLRHVGPTATVRAMFGGELDTPVDRALVRGSTYLSRKFDYEQAIHTIESIDAPIAVVGLGAQAKRDEVDFLDDLPNARKFVQLLSERSVSISVRGEFTAAVLERLGVTNVRLTGCPSMFYSLTAPSISPPERLATKDRRLGVSLHTGLRNGMFCRNPNAAMRKHGRILTFSMRQSAEVSFFEQGVPIEYAVGDEKLSMAERLQAAETILERFPNAPLKPMDLVTHMVSVRTVEEWLALAADLDAMVGFRFHGNMVALTQGVPCYYYVYDTRLTEFCKLYRLPYLDVEKDWENPVNAILEHDWDDTTSAIQDCFNELVAFYDENGIQHTLVSPS